jgi:hypothetical protein
MLIGLIVLAFPVLAYLILCKATFDKALLPKYIRERLHDDWGIWPFTRIPRRWTSWVLYMPPHKVMGNAEPEWILAQKGYPLAPDCETKLEGGRLWVKSMHPVHPAGQWSIQNVKLFWWLPFRIPCYFTMSKMVFGRRLHINAGLKPDVTTGDWHHGFPEWSVTWTKRS